MPTLIVMPLKPIGGDDADRDIAAGLSDELISALARIEGLRVIARESTGLAASQSSAIASLVPKLGISHALEGSLRQSGEQLRIHLRLNDARSGRTLWAQDYDRNANDILALQREVAHAVATALTLKLGLPSTPAGKSGDAAFLRRYFAAQELLRAPNVAGNAVERAEGEFRQLVRLRPEDARAHAALAVALEMRAFRRPPLAEGLRAEASQEAALAQNLDPSLADTYRVQAWAACRGNRWEACIGLSRKSSESGSSDSQPFFQYAMALAALGYLDRAEAVMRANIERDPINPAWHFGYGRMLDTLGRHHDARAQLAALISPGFVRTSGVAALRRLPVYLAGIAHRVERLAENPGRDRQWQTEVEQATSLYLQAGGTLPLAADADARLATARWMLEELRLSLFAQHLGAAGPVSVQRIRKVLEA
jgi:TolB-like protein